jgi:AraC-like DNA-binding protein
MAQISFTVTEPPPALCGDVECFRTATYTGSDGLEIIVCPSGLPGIVFQHNNHGQSAIKDLIGHAGPTSVVPTSFIYGQGTGVSVMHFLPGPYTTIQVILKPHALHCLFGLRPVALNDSLVDLQEYAGPNLPHQLLAASSKETCIALLREFLLAKLADGRPRDTVIEHALRYIDENIGEATIKSLLDESGLSERHFERRFQDVVGLTPQFYLRVKRFTEATRLMKTGDYETLATVAQAVNFYDQSHFIRDMKEFSGITPRSLSQKVSDFHQDQGGVSYL